MADHRVKYIPNDDELKEHLLAHRHWLNKDWALGVNAFNQTKPAHWCTSDTIMTRRGLQRSGETWRRLVRQLTGLYVPTANDTKTWISECMTPPGEEPVPLERWPEKDHRGIPCMRTQRPVKYWDWHSKTWNVAGYRDAVVVR